VCDLHTTPEPELWRPLVYLPLDSIGGYAMLYIQTPLLKMAKSQQIHGLSPTTIGSG